MARSKTRPSLENPRQELELLARDLDLTAFADHLPEMLGRAEQMSLSYTDFAMNLLQAEMKARQERRLERGFKRSRLGMVEDLDTFNFSFRPNLEPRVIWILNTEKSFLDNR